MAEFEQWLGNSLTDIRYMHVFELKEHLEIIMMDYVPSGNTFSQ